MRTTQILFGIKPHGPIEQAIRQDAWHWLPENFKDSNELIFSLHARKKANKPTFRFLREFAGTRHKRRIVEQHQLWHAYRINEKQEAAGSKVVSDRPLFEGKGAHLVTHELIEELPITGDRYAIHAGDRHRLQQPALSHTATHNTQSEFRDMITSTAGVHHKQCITPILCEEMVTLVRTPDSWWRIFRVVNNGCPTVLDLNKVCHWLKVRIHDQRMGKPRREFVALREFCQTHIPGQAFAQVRYLKTCMKRDEGAELSRWQCIGEKELVLLTAR